MAALRTHHAGAGLEEGVKSRLIVIRAVRSKASDRGLNNAGIDAAQGLVINAIALCCAGPQILDHNVSVAYQVIDDLLSCGRIQIDCYTALPLVPTQKAKTKSTERITRESLNLNDIRAKLGQDHRS